MKTIDSDQSRVQWTFFTNHSHVLVCLVRDPFMRLRDIADKVGITERAVQRIVTDLEQGNVLERIKCGRRNRYRINLDTKLRHPIESHCSLNKVLIPIVAEAQRGYASSTSCD